MDVVEQSPKTLRRETYRRRRDTRRASKPDVTARNLAAAWTPTRRRESCLRPRAIGRFTAYM